MQSFKDFSYNGLQKYTMSAGTCHGPTQARNMFIISFHAKVTKSLMHLAHTSSHVTTKVRCHCQSHQH